MIASQIQNEVGNIKQELPKKRFEEGVEKKMKLWQGQAYLDDRLFILDLQQALKNGQNIWVVTTRRNVQGFPPRRVDEFKTKEEAISYLKMLEPSTPRISLGGKSPSPEPLYQEYLAWCKAEDIPSSMDIHRMNQRNRGELIIDEIDPDRIERDL